MITAMEEAATQRLAPLGELALAGDVPAGRVIDELVQEAELAPTEPRAQSLPRLLLEISRTQPKPNSPVQRFLDEGAELDTFIDNRREQIERAQEFFDDNGVAIITALFHAALPEAYLGRRGVQALDITGELVSNWTRRIQETGQFLLNVLSPTPDLWLDNRTSLTSTEFGAHAARRVRLTHAAIRWMLSDAHRDERPPRLDPENGEPDDVETSSDEQVPLTNLLFREADKDRTVWDARMIEAGCERPKSVPLNQEDLLATLGTFTTVVFESLERLAVPFTDDDREAFYFLWSVVAWHLGIGDKETLGLKKSQRPDTAFPKNEILPLGVVEMDGIYARLSGTLQHESDQGRRMTKALLQELAFPLPRRVQGAPAFIARYLIGDDKADDLAIEQGGYAELVLSTSGALERIARRASRRSVGRIAMKLMSQAVTRYALRTFVAQSRFSERGLRIDPRIASKWGIQLVPEPQPPVRSSSAV